MRFQDGAELAVIALGTLAVIPLSPLLPGRLSFGAVSLVAASLLLAQSLVRDLALIYKARGKSAAVDARSASCMCIESMLGFTGVMAGVVLLFAGNARALELHRLGWSALVITTLLLGFFIKDWVVTWRPWGITREKDHLNLIVRWRA
jgi:hypothetical protein